MVDFPFSDVPRTLNKRNVTNLAHVADFKRMQVLLSEGGVYLDLDAVVLRDLCRRADGISSVRFRKP